VDISNL
jgi:hypothetical protein